MFICDGSFVALHIQRILDYFEQRRNAKGYTIYIQKIASWQCNYQWLKFKLKIDIHISNAVLTYYQALDSANFLTSAKIMKKKAPK